MNELITKIVIFIMCPSIIISTPIFEFEDSETDLELLNLNLSQGQSSLFDNSTLSHDQIRSQFSNWSWPDQVELAQIYSNPKFKPLEDDQLFQGDILLAGNASEANEKTAVRIFNIWPLGIIPYTMDMSLLPMRDNIRRAMNEIEEKTCIRFRRRLISPDYVNMGSGAGCFSAIGKQGGAQILSLGQGCDAHTTILHELMHAIGFEHMHSHRDRDNFLKINWDAIPRDKWRQFEVVSLLGYKHIMDFDYESVMLYGPRTFSENGQVTMESKIKDKKVLEMYEKRGLSKGDVEAVNRLYYCLRRNTGSSNNIENVKKN